MQRRKSYRVKPRFYIIIAVLILLIAAPLFIRSRPAPAGVTPYARGQSIAAASRVYISNKDLVYDSSYYDGGYPPDGKGVCTDVIWKGLRAVGADLKDLVDADVYAHDEFYKGVIDCPDANIDFRRVRVLEVYMDRHCQALDTDPENYLVWMPGDFVIFDEGHIAVVSEFTNIWGRPYIIQHGKDPAGEEDRLVGGNGWITGHFRWPLED